MEWYWIALILGIISPWIVQGGQIRIAFEEGGLLAGLGVWFGVSLFTIPLMFLISWLTRLLLGKVVRHIGFSSSREASNSNITARLPMVSTRRAVSSMASGVTPANQPIIPLAA